jgi:hypothetical protein
VCNFSKKMIIIGRDDSHSIGPVLYGKERDNADHPVVEM